MVTLPAVGVNKPAQVLINVVFPLPFGPSKPIIFPASKFRLIWFNATAFP